MYLEHTPGVSNYQVVLVFFRDTFTRAITLYIVGSKRLVVLIKNTFLILLKLNVITIPYNKKRLILFPKHFAKNKNILFLHPY